MNAPAEERDAVGEQVAASIRDDPNRALWEALVDAMTGFVRRARRILGMRSGEKCPRCGHSF